MSINIKDPSTGNLIKVAGNDIIHVDSLPTSPNIENKIYEIGTTAGNNIVYYLGDATNQTLTNISLTAGDGINITNNVISVENRLEEISALPTATVALLDKVYILTATQNGYDKGAIYQCQSSEEGGVTTYSWVKISNANLQGGTGIDVTNNTVSLDSTTQDILNGLGTASTKDSTDRVLPNSTALVESRSVYSAINTALSSIYTPRGDITCAELTSELLIFDNVGNIYEVSDSGTTTALFLQGANYPIAAGDNIGIINTGQGRILFNLMANAFDLTSYQKIDLSQTIEDETTVEGSLGALSNNKQAKNDLNLQTTSKTVVGAINEINSDLATKECKSTIKVQTLSAGSTSVTFTEVPTTGTNLIDVYTDKAGLDYDSVDDTTSGQLTYTFEAQSTAVAVYLVIKEVS